MNNEIELVVKRKFIDKYKKGFPLILKEAILNSHDLAKEGEMCKLTTEDGEFIGRGYLGAQNKGYGWILTTKEQQKIDEGFFFHKIGYAIQKRTELYNCEDTNAFRVFNGEGDGIGGLTIEKFDKYYLINWYSKGIYEFKEMVVTALTSMVEYEGVYHKKRFEEGGKYVEEDSFLCGEQAPEPLIVKENGEKFAIYLNEGAMVGVFLDQRDVRKTLRDKYSKGKTVLNTFSYTGAFSIFASKGGACKTTSVDLANRSLPKTREHFEINDINPDNQNIVVQDIFEYFRDAQMNGLKFDVVVLDPPSFATSKKYRFSADKNYGDIVKSAIEITNKNGIIIASTNCANFDMKKFKGFIQSAFDEMDSKYKIVEEFQLPSDFVVNPNFSEGNYLKVLFLKVLK